MNKPPRVTRWLEQRGQRLDYLTTCVLFYYSLRPLGKEQRMGEQGSIGQWLEERCKGEHLSLRQAAARVGLSHSTVRDIINGAHPLPETIIKLAQHFGDGTNERLALEDELMVLAGYRTPRPEEEPSELLARLMDKVKEFNEPRLRIMWDFADLLAEIEERISYAATP